MPHKSGKPLSQYPKSGPQHEAPLPRAPKPDYTRKSRLPTEFPKGTKELVGLGKNAARRVGEGVRKIKRSVR